jgi:hypothetical protein
MEEIAVFVQRMNSMIFSLGWIQKSLFFGEGLASLLSCGNMDSFHFGEDKK